MKGPYTLNTHQIDQVVTRTSAGAYLLSHSKNRVRYVGRSDSDLNARLKRWVGNYRYFWFEYATSRKAAFEKECNLYHHHGGAQGKLGNDKHPQRPAGTNWKCSVCKIYG